MNKFLGINKNLAKKGTIIALALAVVIGMSYFSSQDYLNMSIMDMLIGATGGSCPASGCSGTIYCSASTSCTKNDYGGCLKNAGNDGFNSPGDHAGGPGITKHYSSKGIKDYEIHVSPSSTHYISGCPQPGSLCNNHKHNYVINPQGECCGYLSRQDPAVCLH